LRVLFTFDSPLGRSPAQVGASLEGIEPSYSA
jgi:hypothetical protein